MGRNILLGFAGPGKVSHTNVKDLLADYLGFGEEDKDGLPIFADDVDGIRVVFGMTDEMLTDTVDLLWEWTAKYADLDYYVYYDEKTRDNRDIIDDAKKAFQVRNVPAAMVNRLVEGQKDGDEVALIVAWGDDGDGTTEMLVDLAKAKDLKVMDITAGLDDAPALEELSFADDPEPEPEPEKPRRRRTEKAEPEEATEEPRPRRGRPRKTAETPSEPAEAAEPESVEEEVSHARQKAQKAAEAPKGDVVLRALYDARVLVRSLDTAHMAMTGREEPVPSPLYRLLEQAIETYQPKQDPGPEPDEEPAEEAPAKTTGRRRKDGTPAQPRTPKQRAVKEFLNEDGEWVRAGRGRIQAGVRTRMVDPKTGDVVAEGLAGRPSRSGS
jgi:hypothetical protein